MMMINKLREETAELHKQIEKDNLAGLIMTHEISQEDYKLLLLQNYLAYQIVEEEITPFYDITGSGRLERLKKDLKALDIDPSEALSEMKGEFKCSSKSEAMGAAYVVEGSALGGMMISKELKSCHKLSHIEEHHFFNGDRKNLKSWNNFLKIIKNTNFNEEEEEKAAEKACDTFRFFGKIFNRKDLELAS